MVVLTGCYNWELVREVEGEVIDKEYKAAYNTTSFAYLGKVLVPITRRHPAKYVVIIKYGLITTSVNNRILYESVEKGDIVPVNLYINEEGGEIIRYENYK